MYICICYNSHKNFKSLYVYLDYYECYLKLLTSDKYKRMPHWKKNFKVYFDFLYSENVMLDKQSTMYLQNWYVQYWHVPYQYPQHVLCGSV